MRDYDFYIEKAKEKQGFKYNNQVDAALGFKGSMTSMLRKGSHLSPEKMLELAKLAGEDPLIALIDLHFLNSDGEVKKTYKKISKTLSQSLQIVMITWVLTMLPTLAHASENVTLLTSSGGNLALAALFIITQNHVEKWCLK